MYNSNNSDDQQNALYLQLQEQMKAMQEMVQQDKENSGKTYVDDESGMQKLEGGRNHYGMSRPDYYTMRDAEGNLHDKFKTELGDSFNAMKDRAMTEGDSKWAALQREKQEQMRGTQMDQANAQAQGNVANAQQAIAMRGGIGGGASERMAMGANRNLMDRQQGVQSDFNKANLDISIQDDQQKTNMLSNVGRAEQMINDSNVGALRDDYMRQNDIMSKFYEADQKAYGAEKTAEAQRKAGRGSCFIGGQKLQLHSGEMIDIEDVEVGDVLADGGEVYSTLVGMSDHYYQYCGVMVTGDHIVLEDGVYIPVRDSIKKGIRIGGDFRVYNIANDRHRLVINGVEFCDYDEVDDSNKYSESERLAILNG